jgi:hypothetical protein
MRRATQPPYIPTIARPELPDITGIYRVAWHSRACLGAFPGQACRRAGGSWNGATVQTAIALGSVLNKDSIASGVVIQGFRIEGGFDEEATLLAERRGVEAR